MTEMPETSRDEIVDQDSEPTSQAPDEGRPQRQHSGQGDEVLAEGERRDALDVD